MPGQVQASSQLGSRDNPASACGISLQPILSCLSPEPLPASRGSMLYLFSDPSICSRTASLGCKRSRVAAGDTMKMTIFFFFFVGGRIHLQPQPDCGWPRDSLPHLGRSQFPGERAPLLSPVSIPGTKKPLYWTLPMGNHRLGGPVEQSFRIRGFIGD